MLAILSPARNVRAAASPYLPPQPPLFPGEVLRLVEYLREYSPWQLESLLDLRPERAFDMYGAYQRFDLDSPGSPALLAYYGMAYTTMKPQNFTPEEMASAEQRLRMLSALYGLLRPADGVLPHRLGLKKDFTPGGRDLYAFWGDKLYHALFASTGTVINLASLDYAKLITPYLRPGDRMVTCRFLVDKPGGPRGTVSTVRIARGHMARYLVETEAKKPEDLQGFDTDGYRFLPHQSKPDEYVFVKPRK